MKRIINGKLYNTDTATCLGSYQFSIPGNFHYLCEDLYRKKNGEFFLFGEGGAASKYSVKTDTNEWSSGKTIIPLTVDEAKKWAEEYLPADDYIEVFGEPSE